MHTDVTLATPSHRGIPRFLDVVLPTSRIVPTPQIPMHAQLYLIISSHPLPSRPPSLVASDHDTFCHTILSTTHPLLPLLYHTNAPICISNPFDLNHSWSIPPPILGHVGASREPATYPCVCKSIEGVMADENSFVSQTLPSPYPCLLA